MTKPIMSVCQAGYTEWRLNGYLHREDGPAIEKADGTKAWFLDGERHRTDGPAIERPDNFKGWYLHGRLHREDGPAVVYPDGIEEWYINGQRQDPAMAKELQRLRGFMTRLEAEMDQALPEIFRGCTISEKVAEVIKRAREYWHLCDTHY